MSHVDDGRLHEYLDGQLSTIEAVELERHLMECPACRTRLEEERALTKRAGRVLALAGPPDRVAPAWPEATAAGPGPKLRVPLAWAAVAVLAVGITWFALGRRTGRSVDLVALERVPIGPVARKPTPTAAVDSHAPVAAPIAAARPAAVPESAALAAARGTAPPSAFAAALARAADSAARSSVPPVPRAPPAPAVSSELRQRALVTGAGQVASPAPGPAAQARGAVTPGADSTPGTTAPAAAQAARREALSGWREIGFDDAAALLGHPLVAIPGLPIRRLLGPRTGEPEVVVEQLVDSATVVRLYEMRQDAAAARERRAADLTAPALPPGPARVGRDVGALRVEIEGSLAADSLGRLLALAR
jgi:putative zinc finger protein